MKKTAIAFAAIAMILSGLNLSAQDDKYGPNKDECIKYLSYYKEYYKQKAYDDATPNWRQAYKLCPPTCSQNLLIDGTTLVRRLISKNAKNPMAKEGLVDTLLTLSDQRAQYYPKYAVTALNNKGSDIHNYVTDDASKAYAGYESIIAANAEKTKPSLLLFDTQAAVDMYQAGQLEAEAVIENYQRNIAFFDKMTPASETEKTQNEKVKTDLESVFISSKVASCDNLIALFTPRYEANPDDLTLSSNIVKMMSLTEGCQDNDLFLKAVTTMNNVEPSAKSNFYLYKLHSAKGNVNEAISYLEAAIAREDSDAATDADYTYELAVYCFKNGRSAKAYETAKKVPAMSQELAGKAYLLMGTIWASTSCGGDEIQRRAPYWVACDYMNKAKDADPSLTEDANKNISAYSRYFPQAADAFMYGITNGQSYSVSCGGMSATTTARTVK